MTDLAKIEREIAEKGWRVALREWCEASVHSPYQIFEIVAAVPSLLDLLEKTERQVIDLGGTLETSKFREDLFHDH